jgi:hypothetical protein
MNRRDIPPADIEEICRFVKFDKKPSGHRASRPAVGAFTAPNALEKQPENGLTPAFWGRPGFQASTFCHQKW